MRVLLDTNLLVRAAITPKGAAREILRLLEAGDHVLVISPHLLSEVADVLRRDRIRARWPLTDEEIRLYCQHLSRIGEEVSSQPLAAVIQDPKDQAVIEAAVAGGVAVICTLDSHFYHAPVKVFCSAQAIRIMNDADLLDCLRG